jgi:TatA/E family protein of Tat protein translocase
MLRCEKIWPTLAGRRYARKSSPVEDRQLGSFSLTHWLVVLVIILIVFGAGKLPRVMGDLAKGIKSFKANMKEVDAADDSLPEKVTGDDRIPS